MSAGLLALALAFDAALGEPPALWRRLPHPAVLMGRAVAALDAALNSGAARRAKGVAATAALVVGAGAVGLAVAGAGPWAEVAAAAVLLAQRSLSDHVLAVARGLDAGLAEGRAAVAMIVGRDPQALDEAGVARAAIESCAENFSDGVAAPAFWFLIAGAPGILIYKAVNTADSMIGHRTPRHEAFGWAAARLDDALNLAPARLSAALLALAALSPAAARTAWADARRHRSPNAGWPEAAVAGALGLSLAGPRAYGGVMTTDAPLNPAGRRAATAADVRAAVGLIWRAWGLALAGLAVWALT